MKMRILGLGWFLAAVTSQAAPAATPAASEVLLEINGRIYAEDRLPAACPDLLKGAPCGESSFGSFHVESRKEGDLTFSTTVFSGPEGPQVIEKSWEADGHVKRAVVENRALRKLSELEIKGGKVFYKVTDLDSGLVRTSEEDADDHLVVSSTVMSYLRPHFGSLREGREIPLKVAVLDRRESFRFVMRKVSDEKTARGENGMVLELAPVNFIVKALVAPMYFHLKTDPGELYAFRGRSALRRKIGDSWKEMNVRTAYEYKINRFSQAKLEAECLRTIEPGLGRNMKCEVKNQ